MTSITWFNSRANRSLLFLVSIFLFMFLGEVSPVTAQIYGLKYCGISHATGAERCFESIAKCRLFNIDGTCRPHMDHQLNKDVWCLYSNRSVLWGCYIKKEKCLERKALYRNYQCFRVQDIFP